MSTAWERLESEALQLPLRERAQLARLLIASLDHDGDEDPGDADPTEVERAWEQEIRRRLAEYDAGEVQTIPASDVFAQVRHRLT